ncbi:MAG: condensation domain-containing protein, partial [Planktothrix sp.]
MNTVDFLSYLRQLNITISVEGERLHCNAPEGILTPELQTKISQRKAEIITFLQQSHSTYSPLIPISRTKNLPLSFAQQRLWFLDQLFPNHPFYNVPAAFRLSGLLNLVALEKSFNTILQRHEALRTNFIKVEGQPIQKISSLSTFRLPIINLQDIPTEQREAEAERICIQEAQRCFNLATDSLIRITLIQLEKTESILLVNLHHIVSDGWSIGVLIEEIKQFYSAFVSNKSSFFPQLPIQYADFSAWQRNWLQGDVLTKQLNYWRKQLDEISVLNLPTDKPRPAVQTYEGGRKYLQLSQPLSEALEALSQQQGVTLFIPLLTAFKNLLYRYTQQEDIAIGSPIANRNRSEIEGLIGFFVNSLVLRTQV